MSKNITHLDLQELAKTFLPIARQAFMEIPTGLEWKSANDAVTDLDFLLQNRMLQLLNAFYPNIPCLSEEKLFKVGSNEQAFILDPLDGTSNFIQGLRPSAMALALVENELVLAALVIDFSNDDVYTAVKGKGARLNDKVLTARCSEQVNLLGASTGYFNKGGSIPKNWNVRILGSQSLQLCFVASGVLAACVSVEAKAWDDVAGSLLVTEAGGYYQHRFRGRSWVDLAQSKQSIESIAIHSALSADKRHAIIGLTL